MKKFLTAFKMTAFALLAEVLFYVLIGFSIRKYNWYSPDSAIAMSTLIISTFIFVLFVRFFLDRKIKDVKTSFIFYFLSISVSFILMTPTFGAMVSIACLICYLLNYKFFKKK